MDAPVGRVIRSTVPQVDTEGKPTGLHVAEVVTYSVSEEGRWTGQGPKWMFCREAIRVNGEPVAVRLNHKDNTISVD
jgi:hypothetical protein